jgi:hypothetical protein
VRKVSEDELLEFYGAECDHCKMVATFLDRLEEEEGIMIKRLEVWHNSANQQVFFQHAKGRCGGVPFLVNTTTDAFLCGPKEYEKVRDWAMGRQ